MIAANLQRIKEQLPPDVCLVAVSKFHRVPELMEAYDAGQRVFAESRPQELAAKVPLMPADTEWHFIGHLQTNKLKLVLPYVALVQSVDSLHLLEAIQRWGADHGRVVSILLEQHISGEASKQGFNGEEILSILRRHADFPNIRFCGLMGMASLTDDESVIEADFSRIVDLFETVRAQMPESADFRTLSIGMSDDWPVAVRMHSTMVRIGTAIFGPRTY